MATEYITRVISSLEDDRVRLSNSGIFRVMKIGSDWQTLRIGFRASFVNDANNLDIIGTPRLYLGLCTGQTNPPTAQNCDHFFGICSDLATWDNKTTHYGIASFVTGVTLDIAKIENGSRTLGSSAGGWSFPFAATGNRSCCFIEINKGNPNYTLQMYAARDSGAQFDVTIPEFFQVMSQPVMNLLGSTPNYHLSTAVTLAVDESTYGPLDTICVMWDRQSQKMEISDIAYSKKS